MHLISFFASSVSTPVLTVTDFLTLLPLIFSNVPLSKQRTSTLRFVNFVLRIPSGYSGYNDLIVTRKELNFNYFYYRILLRQVNNSCRLADKRRRENEISRNWKRFLEKNKDIKRNNKINQIID